MKLKKIFIAILFIIFIWCLIPIPKYYKDGGTIEYRAIIYQVYKYHSLNRDSTYKDGTVIKILGFEIFNSYSN